MAQISPFIQDGILTHLRGGSPVQIVVDSTDWYIWLQNASTFTFRGEKGFFTAHKERAGNRRGRAYWRAYRTWRGKLYRAYLGQSEELTLERLQSVAVMLANKGEGEQSLDMPGLEGGTRLTSEASSRASHHRQTAIGAHSPHEATLSKPWLSSFPVPLTALIGREQGVQAICDLLSLPEVRLLTITGTGGVGKTRLALEVAHVLGSNFVDGPCFVPLAPISDLALVMPTIAEVLDLHETSQQPMLSVLQAFLRDKQLLLVLDNFEQVLDAASYLTNLLATCPRLKVLVTSRFVLHVQGEQEFTVPPLAVPDPTHLPDLVTLAQYEAMALFIARTQAAKPDFLLTDANARAVAEICVRLDGLPLAIELAAARSKLLPPQALLTRLEKRLAVLTGGSHTSPARQQTLRKTLQWSYDLLSEEEQRLFRRLSVFVGGFTVEAVAYLCSTLGDDAVNVLDGLTSLLDKSLLQQAEQGGDEPRLFMLETVREYGLECLTMHEEEEATRYAHVKYCLALTETAGPFIPSSQQRKSFDLLERERSNIWAALQWLTEKKETEMALQLSIGLSWFWLQRGYQLEERQWLDQALAGSESLPVPLRAEILHGASRLKLVCRNEFRQTQLLAEKMLALYGEIGDRRGIGIALRHLGQVAEMRHSYATACSLLEESLEILREASKNCEPDVARDTKGSLAHTLTVMAPVISSLGNFTRARSLAEEGLAFFRAIDDKTGITYGLSNLAKVMIAEGDSERARVLGEEALAIARESDFKLDIAEVLHFLGQIALSHGDEARAHELLEETLALYRAWGIDGVALKSSRSWRV
jgi:predicted ATPase